MINKSILLILLLNLLSTLYAEKEVVVSEVWEFGNGKLNRGEISIDDKSIYFGSSDNQLYCLNKDNGVLRWKFSTNGEIVSKPLLIDDSVYFGSFDGFVYCLSKSTGELKWKYETADKIVASPIGSKDQILIGSYDSTLYSFDLKRGLLNWSFKSEDRINGAAVMIASKVFFGGCDEKLYELNLSDGKELTKINLGSYIATSPYNYKNSSLIVACYGNNLKSYQVDGLQELWRFETKDSFFCDPTVIGELCLVGCRDKHLYAINPEDGKEIWRLKFRASIDFPPVEFKKYFVMALSDGRLYIINKNGQIVYQKLLGSGVNTRVSTEDEFVYMPTNDGKVFKYKIEEKSK